MAATTAHPRSTRQARIILLRVVALTILLSVVAASFPHTPGLQARQGEEDSSPEIEVSDHSTGQASLDSIGETNPDPADPTTTEVAPPISISESTTFPPSPALAAPPAGGNIITDVDPRKVPSRLSMTYPKPNQVNPPLFAIGNPINFTWEFDGATLTAPPANLILEASLNSDATKVWPIANISGIATSYTWNTANITTPSSLFMGMYTLNIFDGKIGKLGAATSGQLIPNSDLRFGLYVPKYNAALVNSPVPRSYFKFKGRSSSHLLLPAS
ncbi:hypothetical protein BG015_006137 [Linnemannia schmuckeri]|uniref:DUF7137 domain-containing protein n=1 Tax=Linnemannia schmuckeri TaxID=64567 RepID=A0A9P5VC29_9FUNG|nr:hypothetical protein BG015_006137 [Linnemannia schmuckeri]